MLFTIYSLLFVHDANVIQAHSVSTFVVSIVNIVAIIKPF